MWYLDPPLGHVARKLLVFMTKQISEKIQETEKT